MSDEAKPGKGATRAGSNRKQAENFLKMHPAPGATVEGMDALLSHCRPRTLAAGEVLCREGEPGDDLFFLLFGAIQVQKRDTRDKPRKLVTLTPFCVVGQMAVVDRSSRSATLVSEGTSVVAVLPRQAYDRLLADPSEAGLTLRRLLLSSLSRQITASHHRVGRLLTALEDRDLGDPRAQADEARRASDRLLRLAGFKEGWDELEEDLDAGELG